MWIFFLNFFFFLHEFLFIFWNAFLSNKKLHFVFRFTNTFEWWTIHRGSLITKLQKISHDWMTSYTHTSNWLSTKLLKRFHNLTFLYSFPRGFSLIFTFLEKALEKSWFYSIIWSLKLMFCLIFVYNNY